MSSVKVAPSIDIKHGWFSNKQKNVKKNIIQGKRKKKKNILTHIYLDTQGKEVEVTCVSNSKDNHGCMFDDLVYMGKVTTWLRDGEVVC